MTASSDRNTRLDRRRVVASLLAERRDILVVAGLGSPAWDVAAAGDHPANFALWGAMGSAAMIGLGLALAQPARPVAVITGDGELLMGLGSLASVAVQSPANLSIVVLDNERYGETGMQPSHTAPGFDRAGVDLVGIARSCGFASVRNVVDDAGVAELAALLHAGAGPLFANVKISDDEPPRVLPPRDGAALKTRFRDWILGPRA